MRDLNLLKNTIYHLHNPQHFERTALAIFSAQAKHNKVYSAYVNALGIHPESVTSLKQIPFLPITFFKTAEVVTDSWQPEAIFTSSGTTGATTSRHFVKELSIYEQSFTTAFEQFYGSAKDLCILALLPNYLEREGSSLVYMAESLIKQSKYAESGFYLNNYAELISALRKTAEQNTPTLLLGVSFALLDVAEVLLDFYHPNLKVMETGGMKGRRKEMIRAELHEVLSKGFGVQTIHSEYGMTELLSQAYSIGSGIYHCPPWMRVAARDTSDPLSAIDYGQTGGLNVIDLANVYSCSFIATEDLGKIYSDGSFEVLGRFDQADIRGCNLMAL
jgi:phenylacetate-coenzyme A ligase PaaK-like adenylate-forming protein